MAEQDDIQPDMDKSTEPRLDVSKEPQTMSMRHREPGDARLDKDEKPTSENAEAGNKTSLTWNE